MENQLKTLIIKLLKQSFPSGFNYQGLLDCLRGKSISFEVLPHNLEEQANFVYNPVTWCKIFNAGDLLDIVPDYDELLKILKNE